MTPALSYPWLMPFLKIGVSMLLYYSLFVVAHNVSLAGATNYADLNADLSFYGLTVDEQGEPIPGARVKFNVRYYPEFAFSAQGFKVRRMVTRSNKRGRFSILTKGIRITIERVTKKSFLFGLEPSVLSDHYHATGALFPAELAPGSPARFVGKPLR